MYKDNNSPIHHGKRGGILKEKVFEIWKNGGLSKKVMEKAYDSDVMNRVFTHDSASESDNYQYLELLGDVSANHAMILYLDRVRFKHFRRDPKSVPILTRIKNNIVSKESFYRLSSIMEFWPFISATEDCMHRMKKPLLEDVFEAFMGATEMLIDYKCCNSNGGAQTCGAGQWVIYNIISHYMKFFPICGNLPSEDGTQTEKLRYRTNPFVQEEEGVYDAKSILKELFDKTDIKEEYGSLSYKILPQVFKTGDDVEKRGKIKGSSPVLGKVVATPHTKSIIIQYKDGTQGQAAQIGDGWKDGNQPVRGSGDQLVTVIVSCTIRGELGRAKSSLKQGAEKRAAYKALLLLETMGVHKRMQEAFVDYCY